MSEKSDNAAAPHKAGAFDIRNIIGALMGLYGVILTLAACLLSISMSMPVEASD